MPGVTLGVRDRNESAWLLPNDGTRTNHRLRARHAPVRRHRRGRPGHRGLRARAARCCCSGWPGPAGGSRPWTRARSGTRTRTGSATRPGRIGCTGPSRGSSAAPTRSRWARTTPAAGSAGRWCTTPATPRASTPATSPPAAADGVGADWPIGYPELRPYYEQIEQELPVAGRATGRGATRTATRTGRTRSGGNGEIFLRGARALGIEARVGPVAIANGRFGNRPHCIYRGFCLQGCKVNAKASARSSPTCRTRWRTAQRCGPTPW